MGIGSIVVEDFELAVENFVDKPLVFLLLVDEVVVVSGVLECV